MTKPAIPMEQLRVRYEALGALPAFPGEREWVDRLRSFEDFMKFGPMVLADLHRARDHERERLRQMAPELYELLNDAFARPRTRPF